MRISAWSSDVCSSYLVETVSDVNDRRKRAMAARIVEACDDSVNGKTVAILGVTFKPNTDFMRAAPSLDIVPALIGAGAKVRAYDPEGMQQAAPLLPGVCWCKYAYEAIKDRKSTRLNSTP